MCHAILIKFVRFAVAAAFATLPLAAQGPSISFISPNTASAGSGDVTVTISGLNFSAGSQALWTNTTSLQTTVRNASQLTAVIPGRFLTVPGAFGIAVSVPGRGISNPAVFAVTAPAVAISTAALPNGAIGVAYSQMLLATGGTRPYTWTATNLPPGLQIGQTGSIAGVPAAVGQSSVTVQVVDALGQSATRALSLTITSPPLTIANAEVLPSASVGSPYTVTLQAHNATPPLQWSLAPGSPAGMELNPTTGVLSGTLLNRGTFSFTANLTDATRATTSKRFTLAAVPAALTIATVSPLFTGTVGSAYSQTFTASGGTPPYRWTSASQIPELILNATTGALSGTPTTVGNFPLQVQVTDNDGTTVAASFTLRVDQQRVTIATNTVLPAGTLGVPYQARILAAGGTAPYTWSVISGGAPGLTMNAVTGVLGDTPTASGTFNLVIRVRDSRGLEAEKAHTIAIAPGAPSISAAPPMTGTLASPFEMPISASGGAAPYVWSANGLPDGLSIDAATGRISGTPRSAGLFFFTVRIADAARSVATELFQLDVRFPPAPPLRVLGAEEQAGPASQPSFQVELGAPYPVPLAGQLLLSFAPRSGQGDAAVQFASGGRVLDFTIPAGSTQAQFRIPPAIQTGTVAGSILLSARLRSLDVDILPTPVQLFTFRVDPAPPAIVSARATRGSGTVDIQVTGYSTAREVTQAVFRFSAANGFTLRNTEVTVPVEENFNRWFTDPSAVEFGSQFTFTQTFSIDREATSITPASVTLTNRNGSVTAQITQ